MAPDFERLARTPWPMASLASSGIRLLSSALACSCSRWRRPGAGKDAGELRPGIRGAHVDDADRLDPRAAAARRRTGEGGSPLSTQRQNFLSAVTMRCW